MATINESIIVVKVSELVKDSDEARPPLDAETIKQPNSVDRQKLLSEFDFELVKWKPEHQAQIKPNSL